MAWNDEDDAERAFWKAEDARAQAEAAEAQDEAEAEAERARADAEAQSEKAGYFQCIHGNIHALCEQCEQERQ